MLNMSYFFITTPFYLIEVCHADIFVSDRNKECPTCRKKLVSKRSLRPDPNFDALIAKIYPSRDEYEAHQEKVLQNITRHHNQTALTASVEEGLKSQALSRWVWVWAAEPCLLCVTDSNLIFVWCYRFRFTNHCVVEDHTLDLS